MVKAIIFDFGRIFIFPKDEGYFGSLDDLHKVLSESPNYNLCDNFVFNQELLDFLKSKQIDLRYEVFLFTGGKIAVSDDCQKFVKGFFKNTFSADKLKLKKSQPSSFLILSEKIGIEPSQILYIDDTRGNTIAAETAGLQTITFRNNMQFETEFEAYILK